MLKAKNCIPNIKNKMRNGEIDLNVHGNKGSVTILKSYISHFYNIR